MNVESEQMVNLNDLNEIARRLRALTRRYEDFFKLQFQRLEKHMRLQQDMLAQGDVVRRMFDDVQQQKQQWESSRDDELERISQAGDKLMKAWNELENQQRQLLQENRQAPSPVAHQTVSNQPVANTAHPGSVHPLTNEYQAQPTAGGYHAGSFPPGPPAGTVPHNAAPNAQQPIAYTPPAAPVTPAPQPPAGYANQMATPPVPTTPNKSKSPRAKTPSTAQFEYEQLKRQMQQHANRQG